MQWGVCFNNRVPPHVTIQPLLTISSEIAIKRLAVAYVITASYFLWNGARSWWRHQMETFSASVAICAGNSLVPGEFPAQKPMTRNFDVFIDLLPNKRLTQCWGWLFETPSSLLLRHYKNIVRHTAHTIVSWPNPKQWLMIHTSGLMMIIR